MVLPAPTVTATPAFKVIFGMTETIIDSDSPAFSLYLTLSSPSLLLLYQYN